MKALLHYSQRKFQSFTPEQQGKAVARLIYTLDSVLGDAEQTRRLCQQIQQCVWWMLDHASLPLLQFTEGIRDNPDPHHLAQCLSRYYASQGKNLKDSQFAVIKGDGMRVSDPVALARARQVTVIADNLRSAFNVGSLFRSSECLRLKAIHLCGVSATPSNPALQKTALGTTGQVTWKQFATTAAALEAARDQGNTIYALETTSAAVSVFETGFSLPLALVVGNESLGIGEDILAQCDHHVCLPVMGWKNSLNVGVAFAIAAYQIVFGGTAAAEQPREDGNNG